MGTVYTKDIVDELAERLGVYKKDAKSMIKEFVDVVNENLSEKEDKVQIQNLGSLHVGEVGARIGRNPQTGEEMEIPPKNQVYFRSSKYLKKNVN